MGLPEINISFTQKAVSAIERSARGIAAIIVKDDTDSSFSTVTYDMVTDVETEKFTEENVTMIKRAFLGGPSKVMVVRVGAEGTMADATKILDTIQYNYVCSTASADQQELATYIKAKNEKSKQKKYMAVVAGATTTDSMYLINCTNETVTEKGAQEATPMVEYLPRIVGMLAGLPLTRSSTFLVLDDLEKVEEVEDVDAAIDKGEFVLFNDDDQVRVGRGVNSLTTTDATHTEEMKKIIIVEAMNLIIEDIASTFKNDYIGRYKNSYDNQVLFLSAINSYFRQLAREEVLDPNYGNVAEVDVEAQREAWLSTGKTEAAGWDDTTVKNNTYRSTVFLRADVKILDAIEDLTFRITMA